MAARQGFVASLIRIYGFVRKEVASVFRQPRLLLTLIVVLYDRYRPIHDARMLMAGVSAVESPIATDDELQPEGSVAS